MSVLEVKRRAAYSQHLSDVGLRYAVLMVGQTSLATHLSYVRGRTPDRFLNVPGIAWGKSERNYSTRESSAQICGSLQKFSSVLMCTNLPKRTCAEREVYGADRLATSPLHPCPKKHRSLVSFDRWLSFQVDYC